MVRFLDLKSWTIGFRIAIAFFCIILLLIIQGVFALYSSRNVVQTQREALTNQLNLMAFREKLAQVRIKAFKLLGTADPEAMEMLKADINAALTALAKESEPLGIDGELLATSRETYATLLQYHWNFETKRAYDLINSTSEQEYEVLYQQLETMTNEIATTTKKTVRRSDMLFLVLTGSLCALGLLVALGIGVTMRRSILRQVGGEPASVVEIVQRIAGGDLTVDVDQSPKLGGILAAMQEMTERLCQVVTDVKREADNVASGSRDISSTAEALSQGTTQQAAAAEEASTSMEQMVVNIRQNRENAQMTEKMAMESAEDARQGGQAVAKTVEAMREIERRISVIQEIAMQTNMLSMNATIEASKAQEYGKGFAVVAAEVRNLARRTREAAEEIEQLVRTCVDVSEQAGEVLQRLVPNSEHTAELVQEISAASGEQAIGAEQVNRAIQQLDSVIQQNATTADQMASSSEKLSTQADQLQTATEFFTVPEVVQDISEAKTALVDALRTLVYEAGADDANMLTELVKAAIAAEHNNGNVQDSGQTNKKKPDSTVETKNPERHSLVLGNADDPGDEQDAGFEQF